MSMRALDVIGMIVTTPQVLRVIVRDQQALSVMPAIAEDIVILLALGCLFILAQTVPLTMGMLLDTFRHQGSRKGAVASSFDKESEVDVRQAIETEFFVDPANLS